MPSCYIQSPTRACCVDALVLHLLHCCLSPRLREEIHDRMSDIEYGEAAMQAGGKTKSSMSAQEVGACLCGATTVSKTLSKPHVWLVVNSVAQNMHRCYLQWVGCGSDPAYHVCCPSTLHRGAHHQRQQLTTSARSSPWNRLPWSPQWWAHNHQQEQGQGHEEAAAMMHCGPASRPVG
jgi:hypothetical protein